MREKFPTTPLDIPEEMTIYEYCTHCDEPVPMDTACHGLDKSCANYNNYKEWTSDRQSKS